MFSSFVGEGGRFSNDDKREPANAICFCINCVGHSDVWFSACSTCRIQTDAFHLPAFYRPDWIFPKEKVVVIKQIKGHPFNTVCSN